MKPGVIQLQAVRVRGEAGGSPARAARGGCMTRRIASAILTIVWLSLLTAGISTYFITRTLLLADLDETILGRVASLPRD